MKPYIICQMLASIDGKIDGSVEQRPVGALWLRYEVINAGK